MLLITVIVYLELGPLVGILLMVVGLARLTGRRPSRREVPRGRRHSYPGRVRLALGNEPR